MKKIYLFILLGITIISCNRKTTQDLPLEIVGYDTTVFKGGNFRYLGTKYRMSDQNNFVLIHQELELYWFDIEKDSMVRSVNLDTTNLVLPQVNMLQVLYQEADSSLILFFPQRSKIIHLDSKLEIEKEVNLSGIQEFTYMYMPYGQVFYYNPSRQEFYIGLLSAKLEDHRAFVNETRFIGVFDMNSGKLKTSFGEFGEERKKVKSYVRSQGLINFDALNDEFYIRETVGSSTINKYNEAGNLQDSYDIGSSFLFYDLVAKKNGEEWFQASMSDHNYDMKLASSNRAVSLGVIFKDENRNKVRDYGVLFIEDLEKGKTYSTPVDPFQMILWANDSEIYLVRYHQEVEEMILVKVKYKLGESN
ncbi:hypothetical protein [Algoriphagus machipongonensis]|uniref:Lipoprotein n=1 Tax=Algoriphagus machipongonensis TaxID=388413 RepID=A3HX87_9BACT|nr:hypothetical protein [Algoriphagus machipongonensis]EAZ81210.1 hypothetical protein ALPR1_19278 [Algoriphagus machipongonensis]